MLGETEYQETLSQLSTLFEVIGRDDRNFVVKIVRDPQNEDAVSVVTENGSPIGSVAPDFARALQPVLRIHGDVLCPARLHENAPIIVLIDLLDLVGQMNLDGDGEQEGTSRPPAKRKDKPPPSVDTAAIVDVSTVPVGYNVSIVGESYRQSALRKVSEGRRARGEDVIFRAILTPESENSYDPNAIRVDADGIGHIGYLCADDAVTYKNALDAVFQLKRTAVCGAKLVGGTPGKPSLGVMISLVEPEEIMARTHAVADPQPF